MQKHIIELIDSLVGIPWESADCVKLCEMFLQGRGIDAQAPSRDEAKHIPPEILKEKIKENAHIIPADKLEAGDILVFKIKDELHVGVYIGFKKMLHAQEGDRSRISRMTPHWAEMFQFALRPKGGRMYLPPAGPPAGAVLGGLIAGGIGLAAEGATFLSVAWATIQGVAIGYSVGLALDPPRRNANASSPRYKFGKLENTVSNQYPFPRIYGQVRVAGNFVFQYPADGGEEVDILIMLGEGEINSVSEVKVNNIDIASLPGCSYTAFLGTSTQNVETDTGLDLGGVEYRNRACLHVHLASSDKLKGGRATITCLVQGLKVQTWNGSAWTSAKTYSANYAACLRDYLITERQRGGVGIPAANIDSDSWGEAYEDCAESVSDGEGGTEARYEIGYSIDQRRPANDNIAEMLVGFGGMIFRSGSVFKLRVSKQESSVLSLTEEDHIKEMVIFGKDVDEKINKFSIEYFDPDQNDVMVKVPCAQNRADQQRRGIYEKTLTIPCINRQSQALRLGYQYFYEELINNLTGKLVVSMEAVSLEPGDIIKVTHSLMNWTEQRARVLEIAELEAGIYTLYFQTYNPSIYNDRYGAPIQLFNYGTPANPYAPVTDVTGLNVSESTYYLHKDGTAASDLIISWTEPTDDSKRLLSHYQVELKKGAGDYVVAGTPAANNFRVYAVEETSYYVRVKTVSINKIISDGTVSSQVTVLGKEQKPATPTGFDVYQAGNMLRFTADAHPEADFSHFKIVRPNGEIIAERADLTEVMYPIGQIGEQTFYCYAVDQSGNQSEAPATDTIDVDKPPEMNFINLYNLWAQNIEYKHSNTGLVMTNDYDSGYARPAITLKTQATWEEREAESQTWEYQEANGGLVMDRPVEASGSFEMITPIDIGTIVSFNVVTDIDYRNVSGGSVILQISCSEDGVTYSSFANADPTTLYTAQYIKFKLLLSTSDTNFNVYVYGATIYVNAPVTKVAWTSDLAVPTGGADWYYGTDFTYIPRVVVNITNGAAGFVKVTKAIDKCTFRVYSDQAMTTPIGTAEVDADAKGS